MKFVNLYNYSLQLMTDILFKEESYKIIGACFEVHKTLGHGFKEIVYKDALEVELANLGIPFSGKKLLTFIIKSKSSNIHLLQTL